MKKIKVRHPVEACNHAQNLMLKKLPIGQRLFYKLLFSYTNGSYTYHSEAKFNPEFVHLTMDEYIVKVMGQNNFADYKLMIDNGYTVQATIREVHKNERAYIWERDNYTCLKPGCTNTTNLTIDHITPIGLGGTNSIDNYQTLCDQHNQEKGNRIIDYRMKVEV